MRLKSCEIESIKNIIKTFDEEAKVYLFGSRVDDKKKGGDIDILIESKKIDFKTYLKIKAKFLKIFGDRKIDIIIDNGKENSFIKTIQKEAILL